MSGDDLQAILQEASDALIDNQENISLETLDLIEQHVLPLFSLSPEERKNYAGSLNAIDLQMIERTIADLVKHERTLITPDPTTGLSMTNKLVNGINKFKERSWIVSIVAKLF